MDPDGVTGAGLLAALNASEFRLRKDIGMPWDAPWLSQDRRFRRGPVESLNGLGKSGVLLCFMQKADKAAEKKTAASALQESSHSPKEGATMRWRLAR